MLLIDGVKYEEWVPQTEDEFERIVKEHTQEIFGEQSIYLDRKQKLKSLSGIGSIPDGYALILGDMPHWHIVEVELSSHPLDQHIVSQVSRFITGIKNPNTQREIAVAMYAMYTEYTEITRDGFLRELLQLKVKQTIRAEEIYKFLADIISKPPVLTIIIEKDTQVLRETISTLAHPQIKVVEFQTFTRVGAGLAVHAHLFEPLYKVQHKEVPPVKNALTYMTDEGLYGYLIYIKVENFWIRYKRLRIPSKYLADLSLSHDTSFDLETDVGTIKTKIDKWNEICVGMGKWYKAHPELKVGDVVVFKVLDPMKKYSLETAKPREETA